MVHKSHCFCLESPEKNPETCKQGLTDSVQEFSCPYAEYPLLVVRSRLYLAFVFEREEEQEVYVGKPPIAITN